MWQKQSKDFHPFRSVIEHLLPIPVGEFGESFFKAVMNYIAVTCRMKGDSGVLFLLDEFKALEIVQSGVSMDKEDWLALQLQKINHALDEALDDPREPEVVGSGCDLSVMERFFIPRVVSTLDFLAVKKTTSASKREISWFPVLQIDFRKLPVYLQLLKDAGERERILNNPWQLALRFCGGNSRLLERTLEFFSQRGKHSLDAIFAFVTNARSELRSISFDIIKPAILQTMKQAADTLKTREGTYWTFSELCARGFFLNTLSDEGEQVPVTTPLLLYRLANPGENACNGVVGQGAWDQYLTNTSISRSLVNSMLIQRDTADQPSAFEVFCANHFALVQRLRSPDEMELVPIKELFPGSRGHQFRGSRIQMQGEWNCEVAKKPFAEMKLGEFSVNTVYLGEHGQAGCDSIFHAMTEAKQHAFIGIENKISKDEASTVLTVQNITSKWILFNQTVNAISSAAERFLIFVAKRTCQPQLEDYLQMKRTDADNNVFVKLHEVECEERILVIDNSTLPTYLGPTCLSILFPATTVPTAVLFEPEGNSSADPPVPRK